jgi:ribosomal-protein-alanine N-acetyltransferase
MDMTVRRLGADDLAAITAIQRASPEAAQWNPEDYLGYDCLVAICNGTIAGFLVSRTLAPGEREILNLAVDPEWRRKGVAKRLISDSTLLVNGTVYLEVRASNQSALNFYNYLGFQEVARRPRYYSDPLETAIVMKFHSC